MMPVAYSIMRYLILIQQSQIYLLFQQRNYHQNQLNRHRSPAGKRLILLFLFMKSYPKFILLIYAYKCLELQIQQQNSLMNQISRSYHLAGLSSVQRNASTVNENIKYVIIDSQRESQQFIQNDHNDSPNSIQSISLTKNYPAKTQNYNLTKTAILSLSNLISRQGSVLQEKPIDKEIAQSQREVEQLEKECKLLEKIINDMAEEQARLIVEIRIKDRRINAIREKQNDDSNGRKIVQCPVHRMDVSNWNISSSQTPNILLSRPKQNKSVDINNLKTETLMIKSSQTKQSETVSSIKKRKRKEKHLSKSKSKCGLNHKER